LRAPNQERRPYFIQTGYFFFRRTDSRGWIKYGRTFLIGGRKDEAIEMATAPDVSKNCRWEEVYAKLPSGEAAEGNGSGGDRL